MKTLTIVPAALALLVLVLAACASDEPTATPSPTPTTGPSLTATPTPRAALPTSPTASPMPTPTAAPTPTTSSCPSNVTGEYAGNAFNDTFALRSDIRVQMEQSGCQIQGYYTVFPPLEGSGPFSGLVDGGKVNFTLRSNISGYYMEAKFDGAIGDAGGLNGTYVVPPWAGYPDTQVGRWDLTPVVETQN